MRRGAEAPVRKNLTNKTIIRAGHNILAVADILNEIDL